MNVKRHALAAETAGNISGGLTTTLTTTGGLATLSDDEFGVGPTMPMLPKTWDPETPGGEGERG